MVSVFVSFFHLKVYLILLVGTAQEGCGESSSDFKKNISSMAEELKYYIARVQDASSKKSCSLWVGQMEETIN